MNKIEIKRVVEGQIKYYKSGNTIKVAARVEALKNLKAEIVARQDDIYEALYKDLGKSRHEAYMCEVGMVLEELTCLIKNTARWSRPKRVATPLSQFCAKSYFLPHPLGVSVVVSPWNYPFLLAMGPLVDSIAAGNTVILKPSLNSIHTSRVLQSIISGLFEPEFISVLIVDHNETDTLLAQKVDHIFFTGSANVGSHILEIASKEVVPVVLELGGKSPCIVDESANIEIAAKRIVFGKFLNCGQTCVAPDYIYCHSSVKDKLIERLKVEIIRQYGMHPLLNPNYGKIINKRHFDRLNGLVKTHGKDVVFGGLADKQTNQIEPTIIDNAAFDSKIMRDEIFGPLLPIVTFDSVGQATEKLAELDSPLACYIFSSNRCNIAAINNSMNFGGSCINDTIIHLCSTKLAFGGVGKSGMGSYHGYNGFKTFSHFKSVVDKKQWIDLPFRYSPYNKLKDSLIKMFLK